MIKRDKKIQVRLTAIEQEEIRLWYKSHGLDMSDDIRKFLKRRIEYANQRNSDVGQRDRKV